MAIADDGNRKGCDIGYAPAISSCEEANSVEARTVAALDVITAFAVPNPNCPSQAQSVFSGLVTLSGCPLEQITQLTSDWQILLSQPFQPSTCVNLNNCFSDVNSVLSVISNICECHVQNRGEPWKKMRALWRTGTNIQAGCAASSCASICTRPVNSPSAARNRRPEQTLWSRATRMVVEGGRAFIKAACMP